MGVVATKKARKGGSKETPLKILGEQLIAWVTAIVSCMHISITVPVDALTSLW